MRPGLARRPQLGRSRGRQGERRRGDPGNSGPYREGSAPTVGDSVVSSGNTKSPSSGVLVSTPSSSSAAGRFTILGSMSATESVDVDSGATEDVSGDTDVVDVDVKAVGGAVVVVVVVEVRGRTGSIGSPTPATAAS